MLEVEKDTVVTENTADKSTAKTNTVTENTKQKKLAKEKTKSIKKKSAQKNSPKTNTSKLANPGTDIDLSIQSYKIFLSGCSLVSLLITFFSSISSGNVPAGITLTMFIYSATKYVEYHEKILKKSSDFGDYSPIINIFNMFFSLFFCFANLFLCFVKITDKWLLIFIVIDIIFVIYYLIIDMIIQGEKYYSHQKF